MRVQEIRDSIDRLKGLYDAAGAKTASDDLGRLLRLLDGHEHQNFDEFVEELNRTLTKTFGPKSSVLANPSVVSSHASALEDAGLDSARFEAAITALSGDKSAGKSEIDAVAHAFTGGRLHWKSRSEALDAIRTRFKERVYQGSKMKLLEAFKPW